MHARSPVASDSHTAGLFRPHLYNEQDQKSRAVRWQIPGAPARLFQTEEVARRRRANFGLHADGRQSLRSPKLTCWEKGECSGRFATHLAWQSHTTSIRLFVVPENKSHRK